MVALQPERHMCVAEVCMQLVCNWVNIILSYSLVKYIITLEVIKI